MLFLTSSPAQFYQQTPTAARLLETDGCYTHFGFRIEELGCCRVLAHALWGTHVFVGTLFTSAPLDTVATLLEGECTPAPQ